MHGVSKVYDVMINIDDVWHSRADLLDLFKNVYYSILFPTVKEYLCFSFTLIQTNAICETNKLRTNRVFIGYITQPDTKAAALYSNL